MDKGYHNELKNIDDNIFVKKVAIFLMSLENKFPDIVEDGELARIFGNDKERIVDYLKGGKDENDYLVIRERGGYKINHKNMGRVQNFIARLIQEDSTLGQNKLQEQQGKILTATFWIYSLIALTMFFQVVLDYYYNSTHIGDFGKIMAGILLLFFIVIFAAIGNNVKNMTSEKMSKFLYIVFIILVVIAIVFGFFVGYSVLKGANFWDMPVTKISGELNINQLDKVVILNEEKINETLFKFKREIISELNKSRSNNS